MQINKLGPWGEILIANQESIRIITRYSRQQQEGTMVQNKLFKVYYISKAKIGFIKVPMDVFSLFGQEYLNFLITVILEMRIAKLGV